MITEWERAPEWANYKATDADGQTYWYEKEPRLGGCQWDNTQITPIGRIEKVIPKPGIKWQDTLEYRGVVYDTGPD
jgi:muconolactone delta-isomerase